MFVKELKQLERKKEFLLKAKITHKNKFDYSKVNYINSITPITIICIKHKREFQQKPVKHLTNKHCCPDCSKEGYIKAIRISKNDFINMANEIHSDRYSYENSNIQNKKDKINIFCKKHNKYFEQRLNVHLNGHVGCKDCISEKKEINDQSILKQNFISKFISKFGDNFDFSEVNYINNITPVSIFCNKHKNWFLQTPRNINRSRTCSCKKCKKEEKL